MDTTTTTKPERLLSATEVCERLGIGRSTLYAHLGERYPRPVKLGTATRWLESEIAELIEQLAAARN